MKDVITKEHVFAHPIDKVWNAISLAEEISTWFIKADFKAEKGYNYTFTSSEEHGCLNITGECKECFSLHLDLYLDCREHHYRNCCKMGFKGNQSEGTKLFLEHSGISNYPGDSAITYFNNYNGGWD